MTDQYVLKVLVRMLAEALDALQVNQIVHADLKPDNILIEWDNEDIVGIKLIDFGSAFITGSAEKVTATTPEYLAPEVLQFLDKKLKHL